MSEYFHLTVEIVREIHGEVIRQFGGASGVGDLTLLEAAVAAPQASFEGKSIYADAAEIAAGYLFFLCRNHPFADGNKRTALTACLVFLRLNSIEPSRNQEAWEELTMDVAASRINREETAARLRKMIR